jgi:hypothetical protein
VLGLAALGFLVRMGYGLRVGPPTGIGDDFWYHTVANNIASGRGFASPFFSLGPDGREVLGMGGEPVPTAFHLPLFPLVLAIASKLGADGVRAHEAVGWLCGAGTVAGIGFAGRRLAGERAGLIGAGLAAVYLPLVVNDSLGFSESLYGALIALVILAALRIREEPTAGRAVALGAALGLAALTRQEALLLAVLLIPVVTSAGGVRRRNVALMLAATAALTLPWAIRNTLTFDQPVLLTTGDGSVVGCANEHQTYFGGLLGSCNHDPAATRAGRSNIRNEAKKSDLWRSDGLDYARDHASRLPAVLAARVGRTWGIFPLSPRERAVQAAFAQRHIYRLEYVAMVSYWAGLALAIWGAVLLRRSGRGGLWLLAAPTVLVTLVSLAGYGDTRFRQAAEIPLLLLAAVALDWLASSRARSLRP